MGYQKVGRVGDAIEVFSLCCQRSPSDFRIYEARGILYFKINSFSLASADFSRAISGGSENPSNFFLRGKCCFQEGDFLGCIGDLRSAFDLNFSDLSHLFMLQGLSLYHLAHYQDAIESLDQVLTVETGSYKALLYKSLSLLRLEFFEESLEGFLLLVNWESEEVDKEDDSILLYHIALCLFHLRKYEESERFLSHLLEVCLKSTISLTSSNTDQLMLLAHIRSSHLKDPSSALACYNCVLRSRPNHITALYGKGKCNILLGRWEEAVVDLERGIKMTDREKLPYFHFNLGWCFKKKLDFEKAAYHLEEARLLDPSNPQFSVNYKEQLEFIELRDDIDNPGPPRVLI